MHQHADSKQCLNACLHPVRAVPCRAPFSSSPCAVYLMVIAWPTYATESYMRWRLPAVSFLRVFLVALPFNFSTTVFNAIPPNVGNGGRFAALSLGFQAFLGE